MNSVSVGVFLLYREREERVFKSPFIGPDNLSKIKQQTDSETKNKEQ